MKISRSTRHFGLATAWFSVQAFLFYELSIYFDCTHRLNRGAFKGRDIDCMLQSEHASRLLVIAAFVSLVLVVSCLAMAIITEILVRKPQLRFWPVIKRLFLYLLIDAILFVFSVYLLNTVFYSNQIGALLNGYWIITAAVLPGIFLALATMLIACAYKIPFEKPRVLTVISKAKRKV